MKKILSLILVFALSFSIFVPTANADLLPMLPDSFYQNNYAELDYANRDYIASGASGYVTVYETPTNFNVAEKLENGTTVNIDYTYEQDGQLWGGYSGGWLLLDNMSLIYDSTQFCIDHADELYEFTDEDYSIPTMWLYDYPNSGGTYEYTESPEYSLMTQSISVAYTDEDGKEWGKIGYYMAMRNVWICLSDPTNSSYNGGIAETTISISQDLGQDILPVGYSQSQVPIFAIVMVLAVAALAVILIVKKRK